MKTSFKIFCAALGMAFTLNLSAQQLTHTIQQGETLYAIARKYSISVESLLKANPSIGNGDRIRAGETLKIPAKGTAQAAHPQAQQTMPATPQHQEQKTQHQEPKVYTIDLPSRDNKPANAPQATQPTAQQQTQQGGFLNSGCKEMYRIEKKDNLYRIALKFNLTVEEICAANPGLTLESKLKKGEWLCIPYSRAERQAEIDRLNAERMAAEAAAAAAAAAAKPSSKSHLNVAVILPFKAGGDKGVKMIELYRGIMMAADSVKHQGTSVDLYAYHSGSTVEDIKYVLSKSEMKTMDVIFGPLESAQTSTLSEFCQANKVRLVTPFSTTNSYGKANPFVYQASISGEAARKNAADKITGHFTNHNYVILNTDNADDRGARFTAELRSQVTARGQKVQTLNANADDDAYLAALNQSRDNLIIPDASSLTATTQSFRKVQAFKQRHPEYKITMLGYPEWPTYAGSLLSAFYELDTYAYSTFYRNPGDWRVLSFESRYKKNFGKDISHTFPRYGLFGFDLGYFFMNGISKNGDYFDERASSLQYNAFQNGFFFEQRNPNTAHVNQQIILVHYTPNKRVEIIK